MEGRLIITGAGGFLGSHLIREAIQKRCFSEIIAITLGADEMRARFNNTEGLLICSENALEDHQVILNNDDILINCAYPRALKGVDVTLGLDYIESVFISAASAGIKGIINISSQSVYDPCRDHPASENDIPCLCDEYAVGKYCVELLLNNICKSIPHTNIRLASLIGPYFDARVPNKMVKSALEKGIINAQINQQQFGYLDVEDAARGLIRFATANSTEWSQVYNLGAERTYSLILIAETIQKELKDLKDLEIKIEKTEGAATLNTSLDSSRLKALIGDYCENSFESSIRKIVLCQFKE